MNVSAHDLVGQLVLTLINGISNLTVQTSFKNIPSVCFGTGWLGSGKDEGTKAALGCMEPPVGTKVSQVMPDFGSKLAVFPGLAGMWIRWLQPGHWNCRPASCSAACKCWSQCGQENLISLTPR
jgi:hypothetical protein